MSDTERRLTPEQTAAFEMLLSLPDETEAEKAEQRRLLTDAAKAAEERIGGHFGTCISAVLFDHVGQPADPNIHELAYEVLHPSMSEEQSLVLHREMSGRWDTPGCDCGHDGLGRMWHLSDCAWKRLTAEGRHDLDDVLDEAGLLNDGWPCTLTPRPFWVLAGVAAAAVVAWRWGR